MSEGCVFVRGLEPGNAVHGFVGEAGEVFAVVLEVHVPSGFVSIAFSSQEARTLSQAILTLAADVEPLEADSKRSRAIPEEDLGPVSLPPEVSEEAFSNSNGGGRSPGSH